MAPESVSGEEVGGSSPPLVSTGMLSTISIPASSAARAATARRSRLRSASTSTSTSAGASQSTPPTSSTPISAAPTRPSWSTRAAGNRSAISLPQPAAKAAIRAAAAISLIPPQR